MTQAHENFPQLRPMKTILIRRIKMTFMFQGQVGFLCEID